MISLSSMNETNYRTLKAQDRMWYGDGNNSDGKEHIIADVSFEKDFNPFLAKSICGSTFKTRHKDSAYPLDTSKGVNCIRCMIKAGFLKYDSPIVMKYGAMENSEQIGKNYKVQIAFQDYKVGDIYEYLYTTV